MAALGKRVEKLEERMEHVIGVLDQVATNQAELDKVMVTLAESHMKTQEQFREVAGFMGETDRRLRETDQRLRETDARIDRLVSGIGEFIRQQSGSKPN